VTSCYRYEKPHPEHGATVICLLADLYLKLGPSYCLQNDFLMRSDAKYLPKKAKFFLLRTRSLVFTNMPFRILLCIVGSLSQQIAAKGYPSIYE
jgi:hypothetical protein